MKRIAIFASGNGSNALNLMQHFSHSDTAVISGLYTNKADSGAADHARTLNIPLTVFDKHSFYETDNVLQKLKTQQTDLIVLAGFLWLVPPYLIHAFPERIINIHPALLPKYGGKGMYGNNVHRAVLENAETESGISIHIVDEEFDRGRILAQYKTAVNSTDDIESLRTKVQILEHQYLPLVVAEYCGQLPQHLDNSK